jgi:hypothetical protein
MVQRHDLYYSYIYFGEEIQYHVSFWYIFVILYEIMHRCLPLGLGG